MKRVVAAGQLGPVKVMRYDLASLIPDVGDTVLFRYREEPLTVEAITFSPQDGCTVAVVRPDHERFGAFVARADDLRVVKRLTTD